MPQARTLIVLALAALLSACASTPAKPSRHDVATGLYDPIWRAEDYQYRIGPGDELGVRFPINSELNTQVTVGPDGRATFPYIPPTRVAGLTVEQANVALAAAYKPVLRNAVTELSIYNYGGGQVYVAGEVKNPGVRAIRGDYTVVRAIFDAGGFEPTARMGKVVLIRRRPSDGKMLMRVLDADDALKGKAGADMTALPGDLIFVPRSRIAEVDRIVQQYITGALPFSTNYSLNNNGSTNNIIP